MYHRWLRQESLAQLPHKWEKTCECIPDDGFDRIAREKVREERIAQVMSNYVKNHYLSIQTNQNND